MQVDRESIQLVCRETIGVPFKKGGTTETGVDCTGLSVLVRTKLGLETKYPDLMEMFPHKRANWMPQVGMMRKYAEANCDRIPCEEGKGGDLITFNITGRTEEHMGFLVDEPTYGHPFVEGLGLIHANQPMKQVRLRPITEKLWNKRVFCYRFKELRG